MSSPTKTWLVREGPSPAQALRGPTSLSASLWVSILWGVYAPFSLRVATPPTQVPSPARSSVAHGSLPPARPWSASSLAATPGFSVTSAPCRASRCRRCRTQCARWARCLGVGGGQGAASAGLPASPPLPSVPGVCPACPFRRGFQLDGGPSPGVPQAAGVAAAVAPTAQILVGVQLRESPVGKAKVLSLPS